MRFRGLDSEHVSQGKSIGNRARPLDGVGNAIIASSRACPNWRCHMSAEALATGIINDDAWKSERGMQLMSQFHYVQAQLAVQGLDLTVWNTLGWRGPIQAVVF